MDLLMMNSSEIRKLSGSVALDFGQWGQQSLNSQFFVKASFSGACYGDIPLALYCLGDLRQTLLSLGLNFSINKMRQLDKKISMVSVSLHDRSFLGQSFLSKQQFFKSIKKVYNLSPLFSHYLHYILAGSWLMTGVLHDFEGSELVINCIYR